MVRIEVVADEQLYTALSDEAKRRDTSVEEVARAALQQYVGDSQSPPRAYSFIGIASSERGDLSQTVDQELADANRQEGWSLP